MSHVVGEDHEVASRIEWPAGSEKSFHVVLAKKRVSVGAGPVDQEYGIIDLPLGIAVGAAESSVVNAHAGQDLTIMKAVIFKPCIRLISDSTLFLSPTSALPTCL